VLAVFLQTLQLCSALFLKCSLPGCVVVLSRLLFRSHVQAKVILRLLQIFRVNALPHFSNPEYVERPMSFSAVY